MAELRPIPLVQLLTRIREEPARTNTLFDFPLPKAWRPSGLDLSVDIHGHHAETPVGPAAGPHAQLAQNVILSWLGGARVIELKTVQILDELKIPRPCIDAATIGFNVEWSQELRLEESLREYVTAWLLLAVLRELNPLQLKDPRAADPVLELSVGYDFAGLTSPRMRDYLLQCKNIQPIADSLRGEIDDPKLREVELRSDMISCVTLSTFHGCPPDEIEKIARYLIHEIGVDVIVKLNPTLLGFDEVVYLLHDRMGYHELRPRKSAFESDLKWEDAIGLGRRLGDEAARVGRSFGVKMTNTLVVENHKTFFGEKEMYLSGAPLHVLAMHCVERWRAALGTRVPISFSGGIDQHNVADAVACDLVPVTSCTDLLRPGGYARMPKYLLNLAEAMEACGARTRDEFILKRFGKEAEARRLVRAEIDEDGVTADEEARVVRMAGMLNAHEVTARVTGDPRYAAGKNGKPPRKVGSTLVLFDCLSCDKCVPVCPNDANFSIPTPAGEFPSVDVIVDGAARTEPGPMFVIRKSEQWANFADACNECGNCDVFCPEDGGPYVVKARWFGARADWEKSALDGMHVALDGGAIDVRARIAGKNYELRVEGGAARLSDGRVRVRYDAASGAVLEIEDAGQGPHRLPGAIFLTLRALISGVLDPSRMNPVSAALPGARWS